jgi:prevent-host-death family protein
MNKVNIHRAKTHFSSLVELAARGEEVVIAKAGKPVARLVPYFPKREARRPGRLRGKVRIKKDFDRPLPEGILASFEGRS